jgi:hypothetical protein
LRQRRQFPSRLTHGQYLDALQSRFPAAWTAIHVDAQQQHYPLGQALFPWRLVGQV